MKPEAAGEIEPLHFASRRSEQVKQRRDAGRDGGLGLKESRDVQFGDPDWPGGAAGMQPQFSPLGVGLDHVARARAEPAVKPTAGLQDAPPPRLPEKVHVGRTADAERSVGRADDAEFRHKGLRLQPYAL